MDCEVRLATPEDAPGIRSIYAPVVERTAISFEIEPPSVGEVAERIESTMQQYPWLVCESGGTVVGYAAASSLRSTPPYRWTAELSVYVAERARRAGVGTALYTSLLATLETQGYCDAYAVTTLPNPASTALHERTGFERVGAFPAAGYKQGQWHDIRWWHRQLRDRPAEPDPPVALPELRERPELEAALRAGRTEVDD